MKPVLVLLVSCLLTTALFSQKMVYNEKISYTYFDKNWGEIPTMDSAAYVRVFMGLDSIRPYYEVRDYTIKGTLLSSVGSASRRYLKPEGPATWYNDNRKPWRAGRFENGDPAGQWTEFYPNGQVKEQYSFSRDDHDRSRRYINNSWDTAGRAEVVDGNGRYLGRDDSTLAVIEKGMVKNGRHDGTWEGFDENGNKIYEEEYDNGAFKKGKRFDTPGQFTYNKLWDPPTFPGRDDAMSKFLRKHIKYPRSAQENGAYGIVTVKFTVNEDGSISGAAIHEGIEKSLNEEALRVVKLMPAWRPGKIRGKVAAIQTHLPISFLF